MVLKKHKETPNNQKQTIENTKGEKIAVIAIFISIIFAVLITVFGMSYYKMKIHELGLINSKSYANYDKHYVLITEHREEPFWNSVYEGACEEGKLHNIYVENFGSGLPITYSIDELLKMAIAAKVDGIIVEASNEENTKNLINEATKEGIPVITVLEDSIQSKRQCFVGLNYYNLGKDYGTQIIDALASTEDKSEDEKKEKSVTRVMVLLDGDSKKTNKNIILTGIKEKVADKNVLVEAITIDSQNSFSTEEAIRNMIMRTEAKPCILVCLNYVDTMCAYQAVVDYNMVGKIKIIGYYESEELLMAIQKEIIHSTIVIDTKQMGEYCVKALVEYSETKHMNEYVSVKTNLITLNNVNTYIENRKLNKTNENN